MKKLIATIRRAVYRLTHKPSSLPQRRSQHPAGSVESLYEMLVFGPNHIQRRAAKLVMESPKFSAVPGCMGHIYREHKKFPEYHEKAAENLASCGNARYLAEMLRTAQTEKAFAYLYAAFIKLNPGVEEVALALQFARRESVPSEEVTLELQDATLSPQKEEALRTLVAIGKKYCEDFAFEMILVGCFPSRYYEDRHVAVCAFGHRPHDRQQLLRFYFGRYALCF